MTTYKVTLRTKPRHTTARYIDLYKGTDVDIAEAVFSAVYSVIKEACSHIHLYASLTKHSDESFIIRHTGDKEEE